MGKEEFGIESNALILSFIGSFGAVKAILNLFAGNISDRWVRKNVLVLGWLFGLPVPFILLFAPTWNWVIFANILLGIGNNNMIRKIRKKLNLIAMYYNYSCEQNL